MADAPISSDNNITKTAAHSLFLGYKNLARDVIKRAKEDIKTKTPAFVEKNKYIHNYEEKPEKWMAKVDDSTSKKFSSIDNSILHSALSKREKEEARSYCSDCYDSFRGELPDIVTKIVIEIENALYEECAILLKKHPKYKKASADCKVVISRIVFSSVLDFSKSRKKRLHNIGRSFLNAIDDTDFVIKTLDLFKSARRMREEDYNIAMAWMMGK